MRVRTARRALWWLLGIVGLALALMALGGDDDARGVLAGLVAVAVIVGALSLGVWWYREVPRQDASAAESRRLGLDFAARDPFDMLSLGFLVFSRVAESRDLLNVMWGTWRGLEVRVFEYREQPTEHVLLRWMCAMTPAPPGWRRVAIQRETPRDLAAGVVGLGTQGLPEVDFESDAFNRTFDVRTDERAFASALVDARMMAWLLSQAPGSSFEVHRGWVLAATQVDHPWEAQHALELLGDFIERVPRAVVSIYGAPQTPAT